MSAEIEPRDRGYDFLGLERLHIRAEAADPQNLIILSIGFIDLAEVLVVIFEDGTRVSLITGRRANAPRCLSLIHI